MIMSSCCPICYKVSTTNSTRHGETEDESEVQRIFFKVFKRYVQGNGEMDRSEQPHFPPEKFTQIGLISCRECIQLMTSFCELYHQLKKTELLLNWKVWTMGNIMKAAQGASARIKCFRKIVKIVVVGEHRWGSGDELVESVFKTKESLITECSQKVVDAFPKLSLVQWLPDDGASSNKSIRFSPVQDVVEVPSLNQNNILDESDCVNVNSVSILSKRTDQQVEVDQGKVFKCNMDQKPEPLSPKITENSALVPVTAGLRSIYKCPHCKKTFSSTERLQFHMERAHFGSSTIDNIITALSDSEDSRSDVDDSDSDHLTWTSSSGEEDNANNPTDDARSINSERDSDDEPDVKQVMQHPEQETKFRIGSTSSSSSGSGTDCSSDSSEDQNRRQGPECRLKCPECPYLSRDIKSFLLHRRTSECCRIVYDPNKSIKVEVRVRGVEENANPFSPSFTKVFTLIDIPQAIFICEVCDLALYSKDDLESHEKLHGSFRCQFCDVEKSYAVNLSIHEFKHATMTRPSHGRCPRCSFEWTLEGNNQEYVHHHLQKHLGLSLNEPKCAICKNEDFSENGLGNHLKSHHDITPPAKIRKCGVDTCTAYFLTSDQLSSHRRDRHNRGKTYHCEDCNEQFYHPRKFWHHRKKKHASAEGGLPCPVPKCTRLSGTEEELLWHIKRAGAFHRWLAKHNNINNEECNIQCPKCDKSCLGVAALRQHVIKAHDVSHVCEICGKEFKSRTNLEKHQLVHSGPGSWEFECKVCSKKCKDKGKLNEHMRTHSNDKAYVCDLCGQSYAHRHNLRIHVNSKHGDRVQDIPQKYDKSNLTSRKGIKRKKQVEEVETGSSGDSNSD